MHLAKNLPAGSAAPKGKAQPPNQLYQNNPVQAIDAWRHSILRRLVTRSLTAEDLAEIDGIVPHRRSFFCIFLRFGQSTPGHPPPSPQAAARLAGEKIAAALGTLEQTVCFPYSSYESTLCILCCSSQSIPKNVPLVLAALNRFIGEMREALHTDLALGFSPVKTDLLLNAQEACEEARTACDLYFYYGYNLPLRFRRKHMAVEPLNLGQYCNLRGISTCLLVGNLAQASVQLQHFLNSSVSPVVALPGEFKAELIGAFTAICNLTLLPGHEALYQKQVNYLRNMVATSGSYKDTCRKCMACLSEIYSAVNQKGTSKREELVRLSKEYISTHYAESISLGSCADAMYFSSAYFSALFRDEVGVHFTEYVQAYRVEKAKEALRGSRDKIADIALACGFNNVKYFNRVFKKLVGYTPSAYRTLNL